MGTRSGLRGHRRAKAVLMVASLIGVVGLFAAAPPATAAVTVLRPHGMGELDCNGQSPIQHPVKASLLCTDIRGIKGVDNANVWNSRFYDNNLYIGHDEPDMTFLSPTPGSGQTVTWTETLGTDPKAAPTATRPGQDVSHWFELTPAPWYSMALCDPNSYPQLPCTPGSDSNAPACVGVACSANAYPGAGSAFMELQFYPPGFAPFTDATSCDNSHWCAALTIDSLECTDGFGQCNNNCVEPINFAFLQTDGVPTGPPSPQLSDLQTFTPNQATLLMNPGDTVRVHMSNAPAHGGGDAFEAVVHDLTTGRTGYMQASAANGFASTSIVDCTGTPFNFQPEYSTAAKGDIIGWAALQTNISTQYETGHFEPCTSVTKPAQNTVAPGVTDTFWNVCHGAYEKAAPSGDGSKAPETGDALCYPAGDTHGALNAPPDTMTACLADYYQNGDLDFNGSPYRTEWPTSTTPGLHPGSFAEALPTSNGSQYSHFFIQTDVALSESSCSATSSTGCAVPPSTAPGTFYPYWSRVLVHGTCTIEFGNVSAGAGVNDYGRDAQFGVDKVSTLGYPEFEGPVLPNAVC